MNNHKELIINLFNNKFDLKAYIDFTQEIFNGEVKYNKNIEFSPKVKGEFNSVVKSFLNLGRYTDKNRKTLVLAVVELWKQGSVARSRTIQRNFVKDYFLKSGVDSALVVFFNKESHDWRLSLIKLDYSYKNLKLEEDITPAKRFSFLLGENEKHHTALERFMPLMLESEESLTIEELEETFNIEVVTKEFFEKYCDLYLRIKKELDGQEGFKEVEKNAEIKSEEFAKKLMGQLVFLYFLQKKGWLGVEVNPKYIEKEKAEFLLGNKTYECSDVFDKVYYINKDIYVRDDEKIYTLSDEEINCLNSIFINTDYDGKWGSGDKSFIRSMFKKAEECEQNFFKDYLEPIFYNALNDKRGGSTYFKYLNCKIPFLNGGLFQPISENYDYKNCGFTIDNSLFSNKNKNKQGDIGDGVLDVFDRYAFTIKEDEPLEKEVAVDPEMLGKVFENLLDVTDRKKKGAFYTPREIVHYMCQESLINYLINEIHLNYDEAESLIRYGDIINDIDSNIDALAKGQFKMPENIRVQAKKIDDALENVKVADPAVGSGAFPLGMVNEIVRARMNLTYYMRDDLDAISRHNGNIKGRTPYDLKLKTIRRCIHAVDIERSAVDITKLRLWLSLVIEENDFRKVKALPNLDYNIMVGNSLVEEFEGVKLFNEKALLIDNDNKEKEERVEQISLQIPEENKNELLELICNLQNKLKSVTDIIESKKIEVELQEAKKSYDEIAATNGMKKQSQYILDEIYRRQEQFFGENDTEKKKKLKVSIDTLEWLLIEQTVKENGKEYLLPKIKELKRTNSKPYFLWKLNFARVFREKGGFDIVIGNPPYVGESGNKEIFRTIANSDFGRSYYIGKMDLFYFFFHKAIDLSRNDSIISLITTNYFLSADGAKKLRKDIRERTTIIKMINFNELKIFESAKGQHNIITFLKVGKNELNKAKCCITNKTGFATVEDINSIINWHDVDTNYVEKNNSEIYDENNNIIISEITSALRTMQKKSNFRLSKEDIGNGIDILQEEVTDKHIKLNPNLQKGQGVFALSTSELLELELNDSEKEIIKPYYTSNQIKQYKVQGNNLKWIIYTDKFALNNIDNYPNIKLHLDKFKDIITSDNKPYGLHRARDKKLFEGEKILSLRMSKKPIFTLCDFDSYVTRAYLVIKPKNSEINLKYLVGLLNSTPIFYWLFNMGKLKGKILQIDKKPLCNIPIVIGNKLIENKIACIIDNIQEIDIDKNMDILDYYKNMIDELVYELYGFTKIEIDEIKKFKDNQLK